MAAGADRDGRGAGSGPRPRRRSVDRLPDPARAARARTSGPRFSSTTCSTSATPRSPRCSRRAKRRAARSSIAPATRVRGERKRFDVTESAKAALLAEVHGGDGGARRAGAAGALRSRRHVDGRRRRQDRRIAAPDRRCRSHRQAGHRPAGEVLGGEPPDRDRDCQRRDRAVPPRRRSPDGRRCPSRPTASASSTSTPWSTRTSSAEHQLSHNRSDVRLRCSNRKET